MQDRKIYPSLDIMKFIMAMLILTQHTCNEWAHSTGLVHDFFGLGNFAVPFFFACSGFLFFSKLYTLDEKGQKDYYRKWSVRIGKMYLVWSLIYFCFVFARWHSEGLNWEQPIKFIHRSIVYSTYATIWFLPALWIGVSLCYLMTKYLKFRYMFILNAVFLMVGGIFGSYNNIIINPSISSFYNWYMDIFITWRNGLFNASPYVFIGIMVVNGNNFSIKKNIFFTAIFSLAFLGEAFAISRNHFSTATDQGFMMAPAIFFMMNTLTMIKIDKKKLWQHFRNWSMLIFLGQRLFLSAIPDVCPNNAAWIESLPQVEMAIVNFCVVKCWISYSFPYFYMHKGL